MSNTKRKNEDGHHHQHSKKTSPGAKGYALCIGLNAVDPDSYDGWDGKLHGCEFDANDMAAMAKFCGFDQITKLLTQHATKVKVCDAIKEYAKLAKKGDLVLISYSGHGSQLPDKNSDEWDGKDETWVLFDLQMIDDELYSLLVQFQEGVRIMVLSDSCHSGTVIREFVGNDPLKGPVVEVDPRARAMPFGVSHANYLKHHEYYEPILSNPKLIGSREQVKASVVLISGCQDNQTSSDGPRNGVFTQALKWAWNGGKFQGTIAQFHKKIVSVMPQTQSPNLDTIGDVTAFLQEQPFKI